MNSIQKANQQGTRPTRPMGAEFTAAEQIILDELWWAKECELIRVAPGRKLL